MTLRSRIKQRKLNDRGTESDVEEVKHQSDIKEDGGASFIRYEIIEKRGKQYLVPVRYSIRRATALGLE